MRHVEINANLVHTHSQKQIARTRTSKDLTRRSCALEGPTHYAAIEQERKHRHCPQPVFSKKRNNRRQSVQYLSRMNSENPNENGELSGQTMHNLELQWSQTSAHMHNRRRKDRPKCTAHKQDPLADPGSKHLPPEGALCDHR